MMLQYGNTFYIIFIAAFQAFLRYLLYCFFFFFNDTATTEIYTLSLHDALPIPAGEPSCPWAVNTAAVTAMPNAPPRSEEHTSELQSHHDLVCRLLLEKKKN